ERSVGSAARETRGGADDPAGAPRRRPGPGAGSDGGADRRGGDRVPGGDRRGRGGEAGRSAAELRVGGGLGARPAPPPGGPAGGEPRRRSPLRRGVRRHRRLPPLLARRPLHGGLSNRAAAPPRGRRPVLSPGDRRRGVGRLPARGPDAAGRRGVAPGLRRPLLAAPPAPALTPLRSGSVSP